MRDLLVRVSVDLATQIAVLAQETGRLIARPFTRQICANCRAPAEGRHAIHRDGFGEGPEVPLCDACGSHPTPTCEQIWANLARQRHG